MRKKRRGGQTIHIYERAENAHVYTIQCRDRDPTFADPG